MTEEQARVTQCCGPEGCGYFNDEPRPARWCVASDCMAWRKNGSARFRDRSTGRLSDTDLTGNGEWEHEGFCGLAGQPS